MFRIKGSSSAQADRNGCTDRLLAQAGMELDCPGNQHKPYCKFSNTFVSPFWQDAIIPVEYT